MNCRCQKLLFIGHTYHKKTKSCDFMLDILRAEYDVETVYIPPCTDLDLSCLEPFRGKKFDVLAVWQIPVPVESIRKILSFRTGVFFPMLDQMRWFGPYDPEWIMYKDFHIISFSSTIYNKLKPAHYDIHFVQYCPPFQPKNIPADLHSVFLWHRRNEIGLNIIKALDRDYRLDHIAIHDVPDPDTAKINMDDLSPELQKRCELSEWFPDKTALYEKMAGSALYIAPREYEGIGMSFLEAMAMGNCVIAPDSPTMNEYIINGENGILYDIRKPSFSFTENDVKRIRENVKDFMIRKRAEWENDKEKILEFIRTPNQALPVTPLFTFKMFLRVYYRKTRKICRKIKQFFA